MRNNFESLGAHLRNLLSPYATLIDALAEILSAKREGNEEKMNKLLDALNVLEYNNIQDIIDFSFIEQMELINWRNSKLYHMQQEIERQRALEEIDQQSKTLGI
jgi:hypothetical protein